MKILFICTHNRCRSILSEALVNHQNDSRLIAASAGSQPAGEVHALSLKYLKEIGVSTENLKSQSWDELENFQPDVVVTVCDSAANESCPAWFGRSIKMHWGLEDPSKVVGSETEVKAAFHKTIKEIQKRIHLILGLDLDSIKKAEVKQALIQLGAEPS